jgi:hypothetical protein
MKYFYVVFSIKILLPMDVDNFIILLNEALTRAQENLKKNDRTLQQADV